MASLCTKNEVLKLLRKPSSNASEETLIEELIEKASKAVMGFCDRQFAPNEPNVTHYFDWPWESELVSFAPWDLQELKGEKTLLEAQQKLRTMENEQHVWQQTNGKAGRNVPEAEIKKEEEKYELAEAELETAIVADDDQRKPYYLSSDEFRLWPYNQRDGVYQGVRVRPFGAAVGRVVWKSRKLRVTGTWGFPAVPSDVVYATAATVVHWLSVNAGPLRRPDQDPNINAVPRRGIPPEAYDLLRRYKRSGMI